METENALKGGRKHTASICSEICRDRLVSCLEGVVDHLAFENWLRRSYHENGIFVNS